MTTLDSIIIGSGPAGYTASIYLSRANIKHKLIASSVAFGGNLMFTNDIENFPGFPEGIGGPELMTKMLEQVEKFADDETVVFEDAIDITYNNDVYTVSTNENSYTSKTVIIATGGTFKQIGIEGEQEFSGRGVSYCATCDGFFFKKQDVAVIGGGDTALEDAIYLAGLCNKVYLCHRRNEFRASSILVQRAKNIENLELITPVEPTKISGDENGVTKLMFKENSSIDVNGVFIAIGHSPNSSFVSKVVNLDNNGYIESSKFPGLFGAGDIQDPIYKQAIVAAGSGAKAAIDVKHFLEI